MDIEVVVSRHPAAVRFIAEEIGGEVHQIPFSVWGEIEIRENGRVIPVLESACVADVAGKIVAGNLPLHLAEAARIVVAVEFGGPPPRGHEFGAREMRAAGARLVPYTVMQHPESP